MNKGEKLTNQKLIDVIEDWKGRLMDACEEQEHCYAPKSDQLLIEILSQMHDAWAVFDPVGDICGAGESERYAIYNFIESNELNLAGDMKERWQEYLDEGYTVKRIKWMVCDE